MFDARLVFLSIKKLLCCLEKNDSRFCFSKFGVRFVFLLQENIGSLEDEKKLGTSPLSQYVATLCKRARQRGGVLMKSRLHFILGRNLREQHIYTIKEALISSL